MPDQDHKLPELESEEVAIEEVHSGTGSKHKKLFVCLGIAGLCALSFFYVYSKTGEAGTMRVTGLSPNEDALRKAAPATSAEYKQGLDIYSQEKSKKAIETGGSFVRPPSGGTPLPLAAPVKAPQVAAEVKPAPKPVPVSTQQQFVSPQRNIAPAPDFKRRRQEMRDRREAKGDTRLTNYLSSIHSPVTQVSTLILNTPASRAALTSGDDEPKALPGVRIGDILLGVNRVTLDSDAPGPAMVEIVSGPYRGAKAVGSFTRLGEHLVLRFTDFVTTDGTTWKIQAYAIDPSTDRTAVRSSVDSHMLARWGGIVAASFLDGFGNAVARSGMSSTTSIYGTAQTYPKYDLESELWMGAAKVGQRAADLFESRFNTPPTVTLQSGTSIGILFLQVQAPKTTAKQSASSVWEDVRQEQKDVSRTQQSLETSSRPAQSNRSMPIYQRF